MAETQKVVDEIGAANIVASMADPMPGSDPQSELGELWITAIAGVVENRLSQQGGSKPVVSLERLAALYPAAGPRDVMHRLWDSAGGDYRPGRGHDSGRVVGPRTYRFLGVRDEFMYRGDLL